MNPLKQVVMDAARRNYHFYLATRWLYRTAKYYGVVGKVKARRLLGLRQNELGERLIYVNPDCIQYWSSLATCKFSDVGLVRDGDWDLKGVLIKEHHYYESIRDIVLDKKRWEETPLYYHLKQRYDSGEIAQGIRSEEDLKEMGRKIKNLYNDIAQNGYKRQSELCGAGSHPLLNLDDVAVNIGRDGQLILVDGAHRVVIAQLLGLSRIPVRVCVRHAEWADLKERICRFADFNEGYIYQKLNHPDLMDIVSAHGDDRYDIIRTNLPSAPATVLDIGANWGHFCQRLEEDGYQCIAVENDPEHSYFLRRFRNIGEKKFKIVTKSIFDFNETRDFDVVLALNVFHHFIKHRESHDQLVRYLSELRAKMIIFEPHLTKEFDGMNYYRNYSNEEFVQFVMQHARMHHSEHLGKASDGRLIYKLT